VTRPIGVNRRAAVRVGLAAHRAPSLLELRVLGVLIDRHIAERSAGRDQSVCATSTRLVALHARCDLPAARRALRYWWDRGALWCGRGGNEYMWRPVERRRGRS
jgi:hypothetical protein